MNMPKKIALTLCLLAAGGCALLLTSCSDKTSQDSASTAKEGKPTTGGEPIAQSEPAPAPSAAPEQAAAAGGSGQCDALLTAKCTACHNTTRVCDKLGKKSKARWQRTIERMTERGAKVNPEEAASLLRCLDSGMTELQASCH